MNPSSPAIVAQQSVRALPRWAVLLLCLAYLLPGFVGRTPWKKFDIEAYGFMLQLVRPLAEGPVSWLHPSLLGQPEPNLALLPIWLGAWAIRLAPEAWSMQAARLPFIGMLALTLAATWYAVYALARTRAAQPVAFAFGGEAKPTDYARTLADGALLALLACLGLAQLAHETTQALAQLCFTALLFLGLASLPRKRLYSGSAVAVGMLGLTLSGAPVLALLLGVGGSLLRAVAPPEPDRRALNMLELGLLGLLALLCITLAGALDLWRWRIQTHSMGDLRDFGRLLLWFTWPAGPLALWALWRWRRQLLRGWRFAHIGLPLWFAGVTIGVTWFTGLSDRALLSSLPAIAALAAFALPTLRRSVGAFIDWFTLLFFSLGALIIWLIWLGMETGWPAQAARNVARLAPEFSHSLAWPAIVPASLATLAWLGLVRWRTGRHRQALWKSLVLPAAGTTLCWLLLTTLWLPLLDHARSYAPLMAKVQALHPQARCVHSIGLSNAQNAALMVHAHLRLRMAGPPSADCDWLLTDTDGLDGLREQLQRWGWREDTRLLRPSDNNETLVIFRPTAPLKRD